MPILGIPFTWMGAGSSHSINKAKEVGPRSTKGPGSRHEGGRYLGHTEVLCMLTYDEVGD